MRASFKLAMLLVMASANAHACKCIWMPLPALYDKSSSVFVATVIASSPQAKKDGDLVKVRVLRSLKGIETKGSIVEVDPVAGTDCSAPFFLKNAHFLIFSSVQDKSPVIASICNTRVAESLVFDGHLVKPSRDVVKFLASQPN